MNDDDEFWWVNAQAEDLDDNKVCSHQWVEYLGFTEHYWFCKKCDKKSREKPEDDDNPYLPWWAKG
jgi:hypothetical protein